LSRLAAATLVASWVILAATSPGIPMVWDEAEYLFRAQRVIDWLRLSPLDFSRDAIQRHWLFITYSEGHPAGSAIPIALGKWLMSPFVDGLTAARLGPITLFSVACAAVAVRLKEDYGTAAAIAGPFILLTFPRLFSEAHFATQDGQLTAWWLLLWALQSASARGNSVTLMLGFVLGMTTATKFTGWLAWAPTITSEALKRNVWRRLPTIISVALLTFYVFNPNLWYDPIGGMEDHLRRTFNRVHTFNIPTLFLDQVYSLERPLPWYNTLTWLVLVTPVPTLALGLVGLWRCLADRTTASLTLIVHWATLMLVRALPFSPPHDGIRLFLPAFGFWCVLAAVGAQSAYRATGTINIALWRTALRAGLVAALLTNAVAVVRYYPQTLSHYNLLAGGVAGAARKGMEPAYWWDALDNDVLRWLAGRTTVHEAIAFSPIFDVAHLREQGSLKARIVHPATNPFKWYVLQNRPGMFTHVDRVLVRREKPVFAKYAGRRPAGEEVPEDLRVPLILVFSFEQYQRALR
jgi:hypothetical protein